MKALAGIVCIVACGFVLTVGLSDQTTWAGDETEVFRSAQRIGGQAGEPYDHVKHELGSLQAKEEITEHPGERIGGQAGRLYHDMKHESESSLHVQARIGGQAGEPYDLIQVE